MHGVVVGAGWGFNDVLYLNSINWLTTRFCGANVSIATDVTSENFARDTGVEHLTVLANYSIPDDAMFAGVNHELFAGPFPKMLLQSDATAIFTMNLDIHAVN